MVGRAVGKWPKVHYFLPFGVPIQVERLTGAYEVGESLSNSRVHEEYALAIHEVSIIWTNTW